MIIIESTEHISGNFNCRLSRDHNASPLGLAAGGVAVVGAIPVSYGSKYALHRGHRLGFSILGTQIYPQFSHSAVCNILTFYHRTAVFEYDTFILDWNYTCVSWMSRIMFF
jgi:hypothetical protein